MAIVAAGFKAKIPDYTSLSGGVPAYSSAITLDAAGESGAIVFNPPKSGNVTHITFRTGTVTTGATLDVRVETVDATTGFPTGTLVGTNTNGAAVVADTNDNAIFRIALTAAATLTAGTPVAIVIVNPSGSPGNLQINSIASVVPVSGIPYSLLYTTSWAAQNTNLAVGVEYTDGSFEYLPLAAATTITSSTFGSGTNPNHRALRMKFGVSVRVLGFWAMVDGDGDFDVLLVADNWDGTNGNALGRISFDKDIRGATSIRPYYANFASAVTLTANAIYRLVIKPTSATAIGYTYLTVSDADIWQQTEAGEEFYSSSANDPNDATDWADVLTDRLLCGVVIDGWEDGLFF